MKQFLIISGLCILTLSSCRTIRSTSSSNYERISENTIEKSHFEQLYYNFRDSVMNIKAPIEKSESRGLQRSELETSLARSTAEVDSTGSLTHSIENKDSIQTKVIYRDKYHTKHDTIYINMTDTLRFNNTEYVVKELTPIQQMQINGSRIFLLAALLYLGWRALKKRLTL